MMKVRQVDRYRAKDYLKRAEECNNAMQRSFESNEWNACVINAIHCAISSADALCIFTKGIRNASEDHKDAIALFISIDTNSEEIKRNANHLSNLMKIKTDAEYGEGVFRQKDAEESMKHAERLFQFVKSRCTLQ